MADEPLNDQPELLEFGSTSWLRADAPFYFSGHDFEEFQCLVDQWNQTIANRHGLRQIVLETWLLLDYWVRVTLCGAFGISEHSTPEFDLRYELLPHSFERCLWLLQNLHKAHSVLPEPDRPPSGPQLTGSYAFWKLLKSEHPALLEQLLQIQKAYLESRFGQGSADGFAFDECGSSATSLQAIQWRKRKVEKLPRGWLEAVGKLDEEWYRNARRLNKARNEAAHSTEQTRILRAFGIKGEAAIERAKEECSRLIERLLGITRRGPAA